MTDRLTKRFIILSMSRIFVQKECLLFLFLEELLYLSVLRTAEPFKNTCKTPIHVIPTAYRTHLWHESLLGLTKSSYHARCLNKRSCRRKESKLRGPPELTAWRVSVCFWNEFSRNKHQRLDSPRPVIGGPCYPCPTPCPLLSDFSPHPTSDPTSDVTWCHVRRRRI